jgi:hypothetical protein
MPGAKARFPCARLYDAEYDRSDEAERQKRSKHVQSHHQFHRRLQICGRLLAAPFAARETLKVVPKVKP